MAYRDPTVGGVNLEIGPEVARMTDQEILNCHNETILVMQQSVTKILSQLENGKETAELGKTLQVLQKMGLELYVFPRSADPFKER
ncbi:MAG: transcriptional regulator [Steroidobacteraceae bacterium]|nr:transcriptional regulator [Deltaproteobacteria bacterium]